MSHDAPRAYWPVRLLPLLAAALGVSGLLAAQGPMAIVAGMLVASAVVLEWNGWGRRAKRRARPLALATLAGACVCALALAATGVRGGGDAGSVVARR